MAAITLLHDECSKWLVELVVYTLLLYGLRHRLVVTNRTAEVGHDGRFELD